MKVYQKKNKFKTPFTRRGFYFILCIKARNLKTKRKSAPDSIAVFLCVKFSNLVCLLPLNIHYA
nr:MAG TPA: hypothetical protein [Caudoviricetes sp.]